MDAETCIIETEVGRISVGSLVRLSSLDPLPRQADNLPAETPVLVGSLTPHEAEWFGTVYEKAALSFGEFNVNDVTLMEICLQLGGLQVYWLADANDAQLCEAVELWQQSCRIPIMFRVSRDVRRHRMVCVVTMPILARRESRDVGRLASPAPTWHALLWAVGTSRRSARVPAGIPGMPLQRVLTNVIVSERLTPFAFAR
ncbi:hypothetical protein [Caballeronia sp. NK8]|uniref:hypothetical protein n=1 Tax=Caballeronia sp. NK8 TaxID=140098 RepID=UPI001BCDF5E2|nr:hypothetical protein [Caballeronia sp. NK8]